MLVCMYVLCMYVCMYTYVHNSGEQAEGNKHPVLDVLRSRFENRSKPGARRDRYKIALAIEGDTDMFMHTHIHTYNETAAIGKVVKTW